MTRRLLELLLTFVVVAGIVALVTAQRPEALPRSTRVTPSIDVKQVCLPATTAGDVYLDGAQTVADLGGERQPVTGPHHLAGHEAVVVATADGPVVGGSRAREGALATWIPCAPAVSQGMLVVPGAAATDLLIVNSDPTEASVDLSLYGSEGEITAVGARGIALAPQSQRVIALSVLADVEGPVGVRMNTTRGRVTVAARTVTEASADAMTLHRPATEHLLAGIPAGVTTATVILSNPGSERLTVEVTAVGATATYIPAGGENIELAPRSTVAVDLGASLAGEATGLRVTADGPVAAGLATGTGQDLAFTAPVVTGTELGTFGPARGALLLSNPGDMPATITVEGQNHTVPADTTLRIPLTGEGEPLQVRSTHPVFGAVSHIGEGGHIAIPLATVGELDVAPIDAELEPTLR